MIRALALALGLTTLASAALADALTATRVIRPMAVIGVGDLGVMARDVPGALSSEHDLVGLEARVTLYPGRPILPGQRKAGSGRAHDRPRFGGGRWHLQMITPPYLSLTS